MTVFGQVEPNSLSGASGWAGAGILGLVLAWLLLKRLPDNDSQFERMVNKKDEAMTVLVGKHIEDMRESREEFRAALKTVVDHCEREVAAIASAFAKESIDSIRRNIT